ncbi:hypothetical protein PENSTE_c001G07538 [Penicillium steckii]|uniref:Uncharacterized protein n=1 Tax=Penicillium steckii TaxID=303698 RepID=A0A1V6TY00_9EURO|nr:hypothetical protein PENSTE_c001G07538 [Penicillium steckii]
MSSKTPRTHSVHRISVWGMERRKFRHRSPDYAALMTMNWLGKTFHSTEQVDPIVFSKEGKRLREIRFRGVVSTATIYDKRPTIDNFRVVNSKLIAGALETSTFGDAATYYLYK